jgi:translation initiation factor 5B
MTEKEKTHEKSHEKVQIRQPIVTVCGHVDHGKTSILDSIRCSSVQECEAGGITQKISFSLLPSDKINSRCPLIARAGIKLEIPGFLFIDTPGHAAFSNLRKRGGSLADLAIVVIDINKGIEPQTSEVIEIMKMNKTPFIVALNKIDNISGWRKQSESLTESIKMQSKNTHDDFFEKLLTIEGALHSYGFNALPFYEINDFTKNLALVPCSARTGEGIPELMMTLCGLSQKFLKERLKLGKEAKGVILEVKKEKNQSYMEAIVYDGTLNNKDEIAIASFDGMNLGKIRVLEEILPSSFKFKVTDKVSAAMGIRMQLTESIEVLPGMPFQIYKNNKNEILKEFKKQVAENIKVDEDGIIVKADSLGSLEALLFLLRQEGIRVCKAGIGNIDKKDIISANTNYETNQLNAVILGFNVTEEEDLKSSNEIDKSKVKIIEEEVVYRLIEKFKEWQEERRKEIEKEKIMKMACVCKIRVLPQFMFHNSNPAIFGIRVEAGKLKSGVTLVDEQLNEIGTVKKIQKDKEGVEEASIGMEVAISVSGANFERQIKDKEFLYSNISEGQFRNLKKNKELLSRDEIEVLQKISQIQRAKNTGWGI